MKKLFLNIICSFFWSKGLRHAVRMGEVSKYFKLKSVMKKDKKFENYRKFPHYLSVCAIVKNEAQYLPEWIEYHKIVGVEKFYIYDNESDDNIEEVLSSYVADGTVEYKKWNGKGQQIIVYNHCLAEKKYETKWLAFIDIDEFIQPLATKNLPVFLKKYEKFPSIAVHWLMFGNNYHKTKTNGLVIERFTKCGKKDFIKNRVVKNIVNPRKIYKMMVHHCICFGNESAVNEKYKKASYQSASKTKQISMDYIRINHYFTKSYEEFLQKRARGDALIPGRIKLLSDFEEHNTNEISDFSMKRYIPKIKTELKKHNFLKNS